MDMRVSITANKLKQARQRKKLSLVDVQDKIGIPFNTLSQYENSKRHTIPEETLDKLAELYDVEPESLVRNTDAYAIFTTDYFEPGRVLAIYDDEQAANEYIDYLLDYASNNGEWETYGGDLFLIKMPLNGGTLDSFAVNHNRFPGKVVRKEKIKSIEDFKENKWED